jgi:hypothetical protein
VQIDRLWRATVCSIVTVDIPDRNNQLMHANYTDIMGGRPIDSNDGRRLFQLGQIEAASINSYPGTAVCCVTGELWVTHDSDSQDYTVQRGFRFCSSAKGLLVVNSLAGPSTLVVYRTDPESSPDFDRNGVYPDYESTEHLIARARSMRRIEIKRLASLLARTIHGVWRSILARHSKCMN